MLVYEQYMGLTTWDFCYNEGRGPWKEFDRQWVNHEIIRLDFMSEFARRILTPDESLGLVLCLGFLFNI
jgi:hypothetical protein